MRHARRRRQQILQCLERDRPAGAPSEQLRDQTPAPVVAVGLAHLLQIELADRAATRRSEPRHVRDREQPHEAQLTGHGQRLVGTIVAP
jgi:hypothetical protein